MATYGLTDRQRSNYFSLVPTKIPENFINFLHLFVYDTNDRLINQKRFSFQEILSSDNYTELSGVVKLNIGQHLRDLGYTQGDFRVEYKFLKVIVEDGTRFWFKPHSEGSDAGILYESLVEGEDYDSFENESTGETEYYLLDSNGQKLEQSQIFPTSIKYKISDISADRTEILIAPDRQAPIVLQGAANTQLDLIDKGTVTIPSKIPNLLNQSIKFQNNENNPNDELYILELPESDVNVFDKLNEGQTIVFENFFSAYIPTHWKGQFWRDNNRRDYSYALNNGPDENIQVKEIEYKDTYIPAALDIPGIQINLPFFTNNKDLLVTKYNSNDSDRVSSLPIGTFIERITRDSDLRNISVLPKDVWQTKDLGPRSDGTYHYDFAGFYPYKYNKSDDTDNIDWRGALVRDEGAAGLDESGISISFKNGYTTNKYKTSVYLNWTTTITKVIDRKTIQVKANLKEQYYKLREYGFSIYKIGSVDYTPLMITKLPFDKLSTSNFYFTGETNDIQQFRTYLKINDDFYLITNYKQKLDERAFKLQQPLQSNVLVSDNITDDVNPQNISIVSEVLNPYRDSITLIPPQVVNNTFLYPANFDGQYNLIQEQPTEYKSYNELTSSKSSQTDDIERLLISGSLLDVQPNIDYQKTTTDLTEELDDTGFGNFVHFSNAETRLRNFKKKLVLIEGYNAESSSLTSITSATSKIRKIEKKRQRVYNSFNPYETYLYYESSSYLSSSNGQFHDTSWPKTNSSKPYTLEHTTGSTAISWFDTMILSASNYDYNNQNSLRNSLPEHVNQDSQNNVFLEFMDMVGEQFDETWTYIKSLTDVNMRVNNISEGISKDVSRYYADALGIKLYDGNSLTDLSEFLLGKNTDGSDKNESSGEALTEETWKRILANLPFFIKTKGTERALKGIMNCYGIPSSVLRVREFGGPDKGTRVSYEIKRKFTYALDFKAAQYIKVPWKSASDGLTPDTVEFRFRTPYSVGDSGSMALIVKSGSSNESWAISLQDNGYNDNYGYLRFSISSSSYPNSVEYITSSLQPYYNNEMWSVMLTRKSSSDSSEFTEDSIYASASFELISKQYDSTRQRIIYQTSESLETGHDSLLAAFTGSGELYIGGFGGYDGSKFSGSMMEVRVWSEPLSQSVFDNHVRTPKAYNGNTTASAYDNLLLRLPLNDNRNLQTSPTASNYSYIKTYQGHISGSNVDGFTGNFYRSLVDQEKIKVPNVGIRRNATKIRLEDNNLPLGVNLSPELKQEESSQDFAPLDTNKLGVYFSPTDVINEDIIYTLSDFNMDNEIGDPRDEYEDTYRGLRKTRFDYFKRYVGGHNHFFDYLRILDFYDNSVFEVLKQFVPARAQADFGNLIESNILERNKQFKRKPELTTPYYENAGDFEVGVQVTRFISGSDDNYITVNGEFPYYESVIGYATSSRGTQRPTQVHINELKPLSIEASTYATASVTRGGTNIEFKETYQPYIENQRLSLFNTQRKYFYTKSLSLSTTNGYGSTWQYPGGFYVYSSSLDPTEYEKITTDTITDKLFYLGTQLNKFNNTGGEDPVQIEIVSATSLTTTTPGDSYLDVD